MLIELIFVFIIQIELSSQKCIEGENNCIKCHPQTQLCVKCDKDIYISNSQGICEPSHQCKLGYNNCLECNEEQNLCKKCDLGYYPDENGGCSYTRNCELSYKGECLKCKYRYILVGAKDDLKYCKSLNSDDFTNCKKIDTDTGKCRQCIGDLNMNEGDKKCLEMFDCYESSFGICIKCNTSYYLDKTENKCRYQVGNFFNCKISLDGKFCSKCDDDYYLLEPGYCIGINYCLRGAIYNKCKKCFPGYYIANYDGSCTKESRCDIGDKHLGICLECETDYYMDFSDGKCKSNQENNEFKYCLQADIFCKKCIYGYYLSEDNKCSYTEFCEEVENGICITCKENYYLGLDNYCIDIEHCIYSQYGICFECEDNYYFNNLDKVCKYIDDNNDKFKNCKYGTRTECKRCKDNFYLNVTDYLCYDNTDINDKFYKCSIIDINNEFCIDCVSDYYLGELDNRCTNNYGCDLSDKENLDRCIECNEYYCLDINTGKCEYNEELYSEEKKIYFRCNRTNKEGTECEVCIEGYNLSNGLCKENFHCIEEKDGICQKCHNSFSYHFCLNEDFGCIQIFYDNCLECNNNENFNRCTKCYEGYKLNKFNECVLIEED